MKNWKKKILGITLALMVLVGAFTPPVRSFFELPAEQQVVLGDKIQLDWRLPPSLAKQIAWIVYDAQGGSKVAWASGGFSATEAGDLHLQLKLFGIIPLKNINIQVVKPVAVVPGGHSIGILLHTQGVLVVGEAGVETPQGEKKYPARRAGLEVGDVILAVNGQEVKSEEDLADMIHRAGKAGRRVELVVRRGERKFTVHVQPEYCRETGRYRIGLYVRDSTAGVGTLTFYHPTRGIYGALGHKVMPEYGSSALEITGGRIIAAAVRGIQQARKGQPGEKIGLFSANPSFSGSIQKNTTFGIFGILSGTPLPGPYGSPVPVALNSQVRPGRAEILTVVSGEQVEVFEAYIERVLPQQYSNGKGLVIRITDTRLLSLTGGIIQGMSGSPILQDGKLVGAVTHVFVNDPTRGYGVLAEWMLRESGLWEDNAAQETLPGGSLSNFPVVCFLRS